MAAERGPRTRKKRSVRPRSGREHTKWKPTAMYAGRDGPPRPHFRAWLQRFLVDIVFK